MHSNLCVVGIGEVLMDVFEDGQSTVGGAPLNVVFHLNQLIHAVAKGEAFFLSAVGKDSYGQQIRSTLTHAGISTRYLAEADRHTGTALVFEADGGAGFEIQADVAWDCIQLDESALDLAMRCDATVFGSLAQRSPVSCASIRRFVSQVGSHHPGQRLYDVNLRRNTRTGTAGYTAEIVNESLKLATLVKMNNVELEEVCTMLGLDAESQDPWERMLLWMERLARDFSLNTVALTRGANGALLFSGGRHLRLPDSTFDQALVHPVGAGDSFAAGLLFGIMQGWPPEESLGLADILSSYVVQQVSATPPLPESIIAAIRSMAQSADVSAARIAS